MSILKIPQLCCLCLNTGTKRLLFGGPRNLCRWKKSSLWPPLLWSRNMLLLFFRYCVFEKRRFSFISTFLDPFHCRYLSPVQIIVTNLFGMKQIPSLNEAKCACSMNACCPELMAIVLLWHGGVRGLTQAATFTHGLFRDCSLMLDSTAGKIILAAALYVKSPSKPHSCSQLTWWKWSVSPSDPQNRQKTVGSLPILCLAHEVLGPGHLHCRCPETPPRCPLDGAAALGFGDHCKLPARGWQEADIAHSSAPPSFHP